MSDYLACEHELLIKKIVSFFNAKNQGLSIKAVFPSLGRFWLQGKKLVEKVKTNSYLNSKNVNI